MAYEFIEAKQTDGVLVITLNDPTTRNALGVQMCSEIVQELDRFENDPECRVLVLTGKDPAFCSGANVRRFAQQIDEREQKGAGGLQQKPWELMDYRSSPHAQEIDDIRQLPVRLHRLQKPSIAAVNGAAFGIGGGLALSCDIRIASSNGRFCEAFIRNGLIPADGSCWQLPKLVGLSNTLLIQYTGDAIGAEEGYRLGLFSKVVPHEELMSATLELAQRLANGPTFSMSLIKYMVMNSMNMTLEESMKMAGHAQELARQTEDHKEGVRAFLEKRPPQFKGR